MLYKFFFLKISKKLVSCFTSKDSILHSLLVMLWDCVNWHNENLGNKEYVISHLLSGGKCSKSPSLYPWYEECFWKFVFPSVPCFVIIIILIHQMKILHVCDKLTFVMRSNIEWFTLLAIMYVVHHPFSLLFSGIELIDEMTNLVSRNMSFLTYCQDNFL